MKEVRNLDMSEEFKEQNGSYLARQSEIRPN